MDMDIQLVYQNTRAVADLSKQDHSLNNNAQIIFHYDHW